MSDFKHKIIEKLHSRAETLAEQRGLHLLRIDVRGSERNPVIEVIIDGARAVTIDDCADISRELNKQIEVEALLNADQRLDVMSPGVDEPLVHSWQMERASGKLVEVDYILDGMEVAAKGILDSFDAKSVTIHPVGKPAKKSDGVAFDKAVEEVCIPRNEIQLLKTALDFSRKG